MTARCDNCKHWVNESDSYRALKDLGECTKVVQLWDATVWSRPLDTVGITEIVARIVKPELLEQMSFVQDTSDYNASLFTKPNFFCAHFDVKDTL
jgi:hypothetical protein